MVTNTTKIKDRTVFNANFLYIQLPPNCNFPHRINNSIEKSKRGSGNQKFDFLAQINTIGQEIQPVRRLLIWNDF